MQETIHAALLSILGELLKMNIKLSPGSIEEALKYVELTILNRYCKIQQ